MSVNGFELLSSRRVTIIKRVPHSFCKSYHGTRYDDTAGFFPVNYREKVSLTVRLYNTNDFYWTIYVELGDDDCFYLGNGWTEFVKANKLRPLDFLTFTVVGNDIYLVDIYGSSGCMQMDIFSSKKLSKDAVAVDEEKLEPIVDDAVEPAAGVVGGTESTWASGCG